MQKASNSPNLAEGTTQLTATGVSSGPAQTALVRLVESSFIAMENAAIARATPEKFVTDGQ